MPYSDPAKRLAYQREYEARMRADTGPRGQAWREYRRKWWRDYYAKNYKSNIEFQAKRQKVARDYERARAAGGSAASTAPKRARISPEALEARRQAKAARLALAQALVAKATARAAEVLAAREKVKSAGSYGFTGRINPDGR